MKSHRNRNPLSRRAVLAAPASLLAASLLLAGCSSASPSSTEGAESGSGETATSEKLTVVVEGGGKAELEPIAAAFKDETGVDVELVELPYDGLYERISTELSSGKLSFDVAALDAIWLSAFAEGMASLDDVMTEDVQEDLFPALVEEAQVDGRFVGVPVWTNAQVLFYRTDLFEDPEEKAAFEKEYGYELAAPTTWDEYGDIAKFFTRDSDGDGTIDLYGTDVKGAVETEWLAMITQAGSDSVVLGPNNEVIVNDEAHKKALDAYIAPLTAGSTPGGASQIDWNEAQNLFNQGQTAMTRFWAHAYPQIPEDSPVYGNVGVAQMPAGERFGAIPGAWYLSIPSAAGDNPTAKEFLAFTVEHNDLALDTSLGLAATVSALESAAGEPGKEHLAVLIDTLNAPGTISRPANENWQQIVDTVLIPTLQAATQPGADTQALLDEAHDKIVEIIE